CRSEPQIADSVILIMASCGLMIFGSGTLITRTSFFPYQQSALIELPPRENVKVKSQRAATAPINIGRPGRCGLLPFYFCLPDVALRPEGWPSTEGVSPASITCLKWRRSSATCCAGSSPKSFATSEPSEPAGGS